SQESNIQPRGGSATRVLRSLRETLALDFGGREGWQNGYCTSLENWRPQGLGGSNPSPSVGVTPLRFSATARLGHSLGQCRRPLPYQTRKHVSSVPAQRRLS